MFKRRKVQVKYCGKKEAVFQQKIWQEMDAFDFNFSAISLKF